MNDFSDLPTSRTFTPPEPAIQERRQVQVGGRPPFVGVALWMMLGDVCLLTGTVLAAWGVWLLIHGTLWYHAAVPAGVGLVGILFWRRLYVAHRAAAKKSEAELAMQTLSAKMPWHWTEEDIDLFRERLRLLSERDRERLKLEIASAYLHPLLVDGKVSPSPVEVLRMLDDLDSAQLTPSKPVKRGDVYEVRKPAAVGKYVVRVVSSRSARPVDIPAPPVPPAMQSEQVRHELRAGAPAPVMPLNPEEARIEGAKAIAEELRKKESRKGRQTPARAMPTRPQPREVPVYKRLLASKVQETLKKVLTQGQLYREVSDKVLHSYGLTRSERDDLRDLLQDAGVAVKRGGRVRGELVLLDIPDDEIMSRVQALLQR